MHEKKKEGKEGEETLKIKSVVFCFEKRNQKQRRFCTFSQSDNCLAPISIVSYAGMV